jgi:hypothetical protein
MTVTQETARLQYMATRQGRAERLRERIKRARIAVTEAARLVAAIAADDAGDDRDFGTQNADDATRELQNASLALRHAQRIACAHEANIRKLGE